jgi:hypothetical protein
MTGAANSNETIIVQDGATLTATGDKYTDDTIVLGTSPSSSGQGATLELLGNSSVGTVETAFFTSDTIDVSGRGNIGDLSEGAETTNLTVNLEARSRLITTIHAGGYFDELTVNGAASSRLVNGSDSVVNVATINADVVGRGTWSFLAHPLSGGYLEFGDTVAHGQTVELGFNSTLHIDQPDAFRGLVNAGSVWSSSYGNILLAGIQADSWSYRNDMLSLMNDGKVVDRLRIEQAAGASPFEVGQGSSGIVISGQLGQSGATLLPEVNHGHVLAACNLG